ncbi:MAG: energy transducer TonB [Deltaproteobacteria bacterium]|nr:energy transducer TonB [Deltaproteobacteria bacterium]
MMTRSSILFATVSLLSVAACATAGSELRGREARVGLARLQLQPAPTAAREFPALRAEAVMPTADQVAVHMSNVIGATATARVHICVDGAGAVQSVKLTRTSGLASFDEAVRADVPGWQFEAPAGGAATCGDASVVYTAR